MPEAAKIAEPSSSMMLRNSNPQSFTAFPLYPMQAVQ